MLKKRYNFVDITILLRKEDGRYTNITDYTFIGKNETVELHGINSELVIMLCGFMWKKERYGCEITVSELLALANIRSSQFLEHIAVGMEKDIAEMLIAVMCSEKIKDYAYGRICCVQNTDKVIYEFMRCRRAGSSRSYPVVLTKEFRLV